MINKKISMILIFALSICVPTAQAAEPVGGWVKIDANGNAIGGVIVCTPDVCGNPNSAYAKATLNVGERYVQQTKADPNTGNVSGIGANNPNTTVKVNTQGTWTVETKKETPIIVAPIITTVVQTTTTQFTVENTKTGTIEAVPTTVAVVKIIVPESLTAGSAFVKVVKVEPIVPSETLTAGSASAVVPKIEIEPIVPELPSVSEEKSLTPWEFIWEEWFVAFMAFDWGKYFGWEYK